MMVMVVVRMVVVREIVAVVRDREPAKNKRIFTKLDLQREFL